MADHNLPTTASTYGNYTSQLDGRLKDLAFQNDPAVTTVANPPTNMVRYNSAQNRWEKYSGTVWNPLATTYAINAATANALATGRTAALTGDATGTSAAWTGSGDLSIPLTLNSVNANVGSFGSAAAVPVVTVNAKGLVTSVSTAALGSIATQSSASVAITGGAISDTAITLKQSTTAAPTGEGVIEWDTDNDQLKVGTGAATKTMVDTDSVQALTSKTLGTGSVWGGNAVPVANGGTGATTAEAARTNLGISSMGTQASTAVSITGGAISGTAITLVQSTTAAPTAEGRIEWDTDNDLLVLGTAAGTKTMVDTDSTQTLTNKTVTGSFSGTLTGDVNGSSTTVASPDGSRNAADKLPTTSPRSVRFDFATADTTGTTGRYAGVMTYSPWSGGVASTGDASYQLAFGGTAADGAGMPMLNIRKGIDSTWGAWYTLLNSGNFNTYAPTLTGTGASGTWGINVTGNAANLSTNRTNWSSNGTISAVVGQLAWKRYDNNHTIFDASAGTSPQGTAVSNADAQIAWSPTYPTLMGWNGSGTYGVRVDSARLSDLTASFTAGATAGRPAAAAGKVYFNTDLNRFEGNNGSGWGSLGGGAVGGGSDSVFYENDQAVTTNYTITSGKNAMSAGPITINSGVTVTVSAGSTWTIV